MTGGTGESIPQQFVRSDPLKPRLPLYRKALFFEWLKSHQRNNWKEDSPRSIYGGSKTWKRRRPRIRNSIFFPVVAIFLWEKNRISPHSHLRNPFIFNQRCVGCNQREPASSVSRLEKNFAEVIFSSASHFSSGEANPGIKTGLQLVLYIFSFRSLYLLLHD